jgi:hypothetical protein
MQARPQGQKRERKVSDAVQLTVMIEIEEVKWKSEFEMEMEHEPE